MTTTPLHPLDDLQQDLLKAIVAAMPEPFFVYDEAGRFVDVLGGSDRDKYHDARHLIGKTLHEVFDEKTANRFIAQIRKALRTGKVVNFVYSVTPEKIADYQSRVGPEGQQWFEAHLSPIKVDLGRPSLVVWVPFNITEHKNALESEKRLEKKLRKLVLSDPLTGLLNRRGFFEKARQLMTKVRTGVCKTIAVFVIDLDHFKAINDNYGHSAGDIVLRALAKELTASLRSEDIVGRVGGEEFAILLPCCPLDLAAAIAERLRLKIASRAFTVEQYKISFTISLGVSLYRVEEPDLQNAVKRADAAMYRAKAAGRNQVCAAE